MNLTKTLFAGFGGQGVLLMGYTTALAAMRQGRHVTYLPAYGAEMRGGTANCTVAVSDEEIASPVASAPDLLVVMNNPSLLRFASLVATEGTLLINDDLVTAEVKRADLRTVRLPVNALAKELGEVRSANMVMLGAMAELTGLVPLEALKEALGETALGKKSAVLELNRRALDEGAACARRSEQ